LAQLQELHERFAGEGLVVLAVPSNEFGEQEPWEEAKVEGFYKSEFGVTFPVTSKQIVGGAAAELHPFYNDLANEFGSMILPTWNFVSSNL
jgi:glutathione peroxidase